jgi:hypothetical protein
MSIFLMREGDVNATAPPILPTVATAIGLVAHHATRTVFAR